MKTEAILSEEISQTAAQMQANKSNITGLKSDAKEDRALKAAIKRQKTRLQFLGICLNYIRTSPTKEYLEKEKGRLTNRINMFLEGYVGLDAERFTRGECTKHKQNFEKEMGIPKVRKQLTTITFLLN